MRPPSPQSSYPASAGFMDIRSTSVRDQRKFVQHFQFSKQIGKFLDMPTRHQPQKHIYLTKQGSDIWQIWKSGSIYLRFWKNLKDALKQSVQIGCDTFPNELMGFHFEAKPILKKQTKNSAEIQSSVKYDSDLFCRK